jgi:predicted SnoaL-like aldol condensation-catalyzing enzyme
LPWVATACHGKEGVDGSSPEEGSAKAPEIGEGDLVTVHSHYKSFNMAGVDIFRFDDTGQILEHWDMLQQVPETTASGNDMFSQLS